MKDAAGAGEQVEVLRQDVYEDYVNNYLHLCTEARPCRDERLLSKATQFVLRQPESTGTFTLFPFYQGMMENTEALNLDCRKHLSTFVKATELLETLCINLYLQPWKKEIRTLKTFTGPFVYCLLPVFSTSTIQSVLASIGYLPHTSSTSPCEYRLSEDANPDRALQVGFELLLARAQCLHFLKLLEQDQQRPQELIEALQRRTQPVKSEECTEKKTTEPREEEQKKKKKEEEEEEEDTPRKEVSVSVDTKPAVNPKPKPRHCHLYSVDQSIMEMHRNYPDLVIRGRPVLQDKAHRGSRSSTKAAHTASAHHHHHDSPAAQQSDRDSDSQSDRAAAVVRSTSELSQATEVFGPDDRSSAAEDRSSDGTSATGFNMDTRGGSKVNNELSGPQAMSLHITLRTGAGSGVEQSLKPGEDQSTAEPPVTTQQHTAAETQNKRPIRELSSVSSVDEEQDLRALAHRMGQLHVEDGTNELKKTTDENKPKERRRRGRQASTEGDAEEQGLQNHMRPVVETAPELSHAVRRSSRSSKTEQRLMKEQRQSVSTVESQTCTENEGRHEAETEREAHSPRAEAWRGNDEQLAQSFVIL